MSTHGNIIICGAPRAGTTSLYRYLLEHADIVGSEKKELSYFLGGSAETDEFFKDSANESQYWSIFPDGENRHSLEASPIYMHPMVTELVSQRIEETLSNPKLIFILRDPVERFISHFNVDKRVNRIASDVTLEQYIKLCEAESASMNSESRLDGNVALSIGCYSDSLKVYKQRFGSDSIFVMYTENLSKEPQNELIQLSKFLGIDSSQFVSKTYSVENQYRDTKSKRLYIIAGHLNRRFEGVLNRFPHIRSKVRDIYNLVNTNVATGNRNDTDSYRYLSNYYESHNDMLRLFLMDSGIDSNLPDWLKKT